MKAIRLPSGDQAGSRSVSTLGCIQRIDVVAKS
jgi:hypothetical protein